MKDDDFEARLRASLRSIVARHPFFGALSLFATWLADESVETAATDGRTIWIAPGFVKRLSNSECASVLVHELLHCALEHPGRRGWRDPYLWNVAADIVVNGMIAAEGDFELPAGTVRERLLEHLTVEEIYEQISQGPARNFSLTMIDLRKAGPRSTVDPLPWSAARDQALIAARRRDPDWGSGAGKSLRELARLSAPELPWHQLLWRFLARTPTDYSGFDRRFVGRGLYIDTVEAERLRLSVCVDTSGSIDAASLGRFMSELEGILGAYPQLDGSLFFADTKIHGPVPLNREMLAKRPVGGGGTSFVHFFHHVAGSTPAPDLCVYFSDGYGEFPTRAPDVPVLWVVTLGGLPSPAFPFGEVARLG